MNWSSTGRPLNLMSVTTSDGFDPVYGARPLCREVGRQIENLLAMMIVKGECPDESQVKVKLVDGAISFEIKGKQ